MQCKKIFLILIMFIFMCIGSTNNDGTQNPLSLPLTGNSINHIEDPIPLQTGRPTTHIAQNRNIYISVPDQDVQNSPIHLQDDSISVQEPTQLQESEKYIANCPLYKQFYKVPVYRSCLRSLTTEEDLDTSIDGMFEVALELVRKTINPASPEGAIFKSQLSNMKAWERIRRYSTPGIWGLLMIVGIGSACAAIFPAHSVIINSALFIMTAFISSMKEVPTYSKKQITQIKKKTILRAFYNQIQELSKNCDSTGTQTTDAENAFNTANKDTVAA